VPIFGLKSFCPLSLVGLQKPLDHFQARHGVANYGDIQLLREQEEVGRGYKKFIVLSTSMITKVHLEVGRWSKKAKIVST
jgi:hypothetical protein